MITDVAEAPALGRVEVGGKAAVLAELSAAGFPVPPGVVVTAAAFDEPGFDALLASAARSLGAERFAVRSSGVAEDLADASYAGLYETYLDVPADGLAEAVRRCFAAAVSERVIAYHDRRGGSPAAMAVLVQEMVDASAAGVAFTAHPVTGDREQTIITAVAGLGDPVVSGTQSGEEWVVTTTDTTQTRRSSSGGVLNAQQVRAVAELARRVADRYDGQPQDIEWAIDTHGVLWLLQARPMTAVPQPVSWEPPGPGLWMRNFRLGEWLPEAVTPLFASWLLPVLEDGYLDGMEHSVGVRVPFRYALVNGWYYNATPIPTARLLGHVLWRGRRRALKILYNALIRVSRDPATAHDAALSDLEREWRDHQLPCYRRMVATARAEVASASPQRLSALVNALGREAGISLWYLAVVGGSAWKMEACLTRFARRHLAEVLPETQVLLRGLPGAQPTAAAHSVQSVDWYHPVAGEFPVGTPVTEPHGERHKRHDQLAEQRRAAEQRCRDALADRPRLLAEFDRLLTVCQHYAIIREEQARDFTLAWPVLRTCAQRLGGHLAAEGAVATPADVFFCTRDEVHTAIASRPAIEMAAVGERRLRWQRQCRLPAPLTIGRPPRVIGDIIDRTVQEARVGALTGAEALVGQPASAGRATGPVCIVRGPEDFAPFPEGGVLVAKVTAPAWTPLFTRAAAVVTDSGTLAAHASLVAREYGIPAVVGTGDATLRLNPGQLVTVDGSAGTVTLHDGGGESASKAAA